MTPYVDPGIATTLRQDYSLGIFFRVGTDPALHLSMSLNSIPISVPGLDDPGTVYVGAGSLTSLPDLELLVNGLADRVVFELNGLDPIATDMLFDDAPDVLGALVTVGFAPLDERWQPMAQIIPIWTGTGDFLAQSMQIETDRAKSRTVSLQLSTSAGDTSRMVPGFSTYTDSSQKMLYPTDTFFARMARYVPGLNVTWPRF